MDWGTKKIRVTVEINPFLYARETKHLTLKDLDSYLIPDGRCRSPLSFSNSACISNLLPQHSAKQDKHAIYNCVRPTLAHIINNI